MIEHWTGQCGVCAISNKRGNLGLPQAHVGLCKVGGLRPSVYKDLNSLIKEFHDSLREVLRPLMSHQNKALRPPFRMFRLVFQYTKEPSEAQPPAILAVIVN